MFYWGLVVLVVVLGFIWALYERLLTRYRRRWLDAERRLDEAYENAKEMGETLARLQAENGELEEALAHTLRTIESEMERVH